MNALTLREPLPNVIDNPESLAAAVAELAAGKGAVALDAERASGHRYSNRAYLVQLRRAGTGTQLIDPVPFVDLIDVHNAIGDAEWIVHAATQDLPCLRELGMQPTKLFDTELAGRLLNLPKVGLASLVEHFLDLSMAKEHSAVDWSTRPLPEDWLNYAALDVEVLIELRDLIAVELESAGKLHWAKEEFEWLLGFVGPKKHPEPWRRTSGLHKVRGLRSLGIVRELWLSRDALANELDRAPSKILPDAAIVEIASAIPQSVGALRNLPAMRRRIPRAYQDLWFETLQYALEIPEEELPKPTARGDGLPPIRAWAEKNPEAAKRFTALREIVLAVAEEISVPAENLIAPDTTRRLAWQPEEDVAEFLRSHEARPWQINLLAEKFSVAIFG